MSYWYHEYEFEDESTLKDEEREYPSRAWASASADNWLTGIQSAFDKGQGNQCIINGQTLISRPKCCHVKRVSDGWLYKTMYGKDPNPQN